MVWQQWESYKVQTINTISVVWALKAVKVWCLDFSINDLCTSLCDLLFHKDIKLQCVFMKASCFVICNVNQCIDAYYRFLTSQGRRGKILWWKIVKLSTVSTHLITLVFKSLQTEVFLLCEIMLFRAVFSL